MSGQNSAGPEPVIRVLVRAMYANHAAAIRHRTLPEHGIESLTQGGAVNKDGLRELDEDPEALP